MKKILWSKGLEEKTNYQMAHTGYGTTMYELMRELNNCKDILWIRNNGSDLDGIALLINKIDKKIKIVVADGDTSLGQYKIKTIRKLIDSDNVIKMYFQNYEDFDPLLLHHKITYWPIGLDLHTKETAIGRNPTDKYEYLLKMRNIPKTINKALIDFKNTPRSDNRVKILNQSKDNENIVILNNRLKIFDLYKLYSQYRFIVCGEGGGLDSHRNYEAWLAGCCVLTHNSSLNQMYEEFATIFINDFSKITQEDLDKYWTATTQKRTTENVVPKFKYSYWYKK